MKSIYILLSSLLISTSSSLTPVSKIDINSYLGHWYQVYTDVFNEITFENSTYCATADYGINTNGTISVLNKARIGGVTGNIYQIEGWAKETSNSSYQGELTVELQGVGLPAPYWIYELGPINNETIGYEYSIVSDPFQLTLFVLARNVTEFNEKYNNDILEYLKINGWNSTLNSPKLITHEGCI